MWTQISWILAAVYDAIAAPIVQETVVAIACQHRYIFGTLAAGWCGSVVGRLAGWTMLTPVATAADFYVSQGLLSYYLRPKLGHILDSQFHSTFEFYLNTRMGSQMALICVILWFRFMRPASAAVMSEVLAAVTVVGIVTTLAGYRTLDILWANRRA